MELHDVDDCETALVETSMKTPLLHLSWILPSLSHSPSTQGIFPRPRSSVENLLEWKFSEDPSCAHILASRLFCVKSKSALDIFLSCSFVTHLVFTGGWLFYYKPFSTLYCIEGLLSRAVPFTLVSGSSSSVLMEALTRHLVKVSLLE